MVRRSLEIALVAAVILAPVVILIATGSFGTFAALYGVETLIAVAARLISRRLELPAWAPDEAYVTRLRRWNRSRRGA